MKKRLFALFMAVAMCFSVLPTVAMAGESAITFTVTTTAEAPKKGDIIEFIVSFKGTTAFYGVEAVLDLPAGVEYVAGSGVLNGATVAAIGGDSGCEFNEGALQIWLENTNNAMSIIGELEVMRFQCAVTAAGEKVIGLTSLGGMDAEFGDLDSTNVAVVPATINVISLVSGIELDKENLSLDTGDNKTGTLTATVSPSDATNKAVTWSSDNEAVATVVDGVVTAVKHGTAVITVKTVDGGFEDTCVVTVACAHTSKTNTAAKDSDCKNAGWDAYATCDDCGQLFDKNGNMIDEIPYRELSDEHTGGTATCKDKAVCTICGKPYGELAACSFTKQDTDKKYQKTPANCMSAAEYYYSCAVCGKNEENDSHTFKSGAVDNSNHIAVQDGWQTNDTQHWGTCTCGAEIAKANHEGGTANCHEKATCTVCGVKYGSVDAANHDGETELRDDKGATCTEDGYTGDIYCLGCNKVKTAGTVIPATEHKDAEFMAEVASTCKTNGTKAHYVCAACDGAKYLEKTKTAAKQTDKDLELALNPENHEGGTELKGAVAATCTTDGHEDDTYCLGCKAKIADGKIIPATEHKDAEFKAEVPATCLKTGVKAHYVCAACDGAKYLEKTKTAAKQSDKDLELAINPENHESDGKQMESDELQHWGDCECGTPIAPADHFGGTATCKEQAICQVCKRAYGELNANNHVGETEIRDAKEKTCTEDGYTGDTWCLDCEKKIATGTVIPAGHEYDDGVVTKKPTLQEEGEKLFTCGICGDTYTEVLPKISDPSVPVGPTVEKVPFADVKKADWFYNDVAYVYDKGLMNGTGENKFSPAMTTDRAMLVTVLWRLEGSPVVAGTMDFSDVADGMWYTAAIDWATANGIVNGYGTGKFGPADQITREQVMTILNRYAIYKGYAEQSAVTMVAQYVCSDWAENYVNWADMSGLLAGLGVNVDDMTATASRAELAAYLHRFMENIVK